MVTIVPYRSTRPTANDTANTIYVRHWDASRSNLYEYDSVDTNNSPVYIALFYNGVGHAIKYASNSSFSGTRFYKNNDTTYYYFNSGWDANYGCYLGGTGYYAPGVSGIVRIYEWNTTGIPVYSESDENERWIHFLSDCGVGRTAYNITYRLTNCTAPNAPSSANVGDTVTVPFQFPDGYGFPNPTTDVYVYNNGVLVPSSYANNILTFTMPDPS